MSTPNPTPSTPARDPVAIGLGALGSGLGLGGGVLTVALALVRAAQHSSISTRAGEAAMETGTDVLLGLFAAIAVAAFFGWRRSRGVENIFQRGAISAIAAFGSVMIGFVVAPIVDGLFGFIGLGVAGLILMGAGVWSGLWAARGEAGG